MTSLLDVLKEADWRVHFTGEFKTFAERQILSDTVLRKRLLLCLFGLGTNIGMKQASTGDEEQTADDLLYVKRYFISREALRNANAKLVNATLAARLPHIWGEGSVACASDRASLPSAAKIFNQNGIYAITGAGSWCIGMLNGSHWRSTLNSNRPRLQKLPR